MFAAKSDIVTSSDERHRSAGIDLLRGICVLLVTLHHIHLRFKINRADVLALVPEPVGRVLFWSGYFAVITFFVISGFLITSLSLRRWTSLDRICLPEFYWLRFARIAPCLLSLVALLSVLHLAQVKGFVIPAGQVSLGRAVLAALTFHVNWLEGHHGYLPGAWDVLWSLSVEEVFYLLFPVMCISLRRIRWLLVPLFAFIIIGPFNRVALADRDPWNDYAYLSCMDGIAFGCLAALLTARVRLRVAASRSIMSLGIALVSLIVVFRRLEWGLWLHQVGLGVSLLELGVALMLVALAQGVGRELLAKGTGSIRRVGRSSYEIYLAHMPVILALMPFIMASKPDASSILWWYAALLLSSIVVGCLVNELYSEPLNRVLRSRHPALLTVPVVAPSDATVPRR
jgi:peptidoglycan/LPS O-acetylase OafA/YrhL